MAEPSRDRGHEALRQDILAAVTELQQTSADTGGSLYLIDVLFELLDTVMAAIDDHDARIAALETPTP